MTDMDGLARWLIEHSGRFDDVDPLLGAYAEELSNRGVPVARVALGLEFLHPEISGSLFVWTDLAPADASVEVTQSHRSHLLTRDDYWKSPTRVVDETGLPYRRRLDRPIEDMPVLDNLRQNGMTDYYMHPLPFLDRSRTATMSFATRQPGGFTEADIERLVTAAALFSPYAERFLLRRVAIDLLDTYVGPRSGRRIIEGGIERGSVEFIEAAIWFADLRGFTALTEREPVDQVIAVLGAWFETMVDVIVSHDGEVLKFMGDAVLAIFPPGAARSLTRACRDAMSAAEALVQQADGEGGAARFDFALGLHVGAVAYGNIGSRRRLDFTVIGPAVNRAARLQDLAKKLDRQVITSSAFAETVDEPLEDLGPHTLRGISDPERVFTMRTGGGAVRPHGL